MEVEIESGGFLEESSAECSWVAKICINVRQTLKRET